ncbi:MAG: ABC transporter permease, partial [Gammaproteobacteria bacterium]|nr:ABC transporter permease [Gammaproteobacteria bacterium]
MLGLPLAGILLFLALWSAVAPKIQTSLGAVPGPSQVWGQFEHLVEEHQEERLKEQKFYERQEARNAKKLAKNPDAEVRIRPYTGAPTFFDQIWTSLVTVMSGFIIASLIAIPLGIVSGLSKPVYSAINPIVQIFKPVSPLAWLPIVTMVVSALYVSDDPAFEKSYINSMITVMLCCLWPTLINTAVGVA